MPFRKRWVIRGYGGKEDLLGGWVLVRAPSST